MPKKPDTHSSKESLTGSSITLGKPTRADLAKIHIAKRDLKLTDNLYRGFLDVLFCRTSAKDLTHAQIEELLEHFRSLGWSSVYKPPKNETQRRQNKPLPKNGPSTPAQRSLIEYLWKHGPGIRNKTSEALEHFLIHHFHVSHLRDVKAGQVPGILGAIRKMAQ
ncbi:MAG: regulatory protein GemA [Nitrospinaceae bacterium]|jgi:hypothetical protein|nr:regulatory protein GemA [Nitrospina sp.]MBT5375759.1 regulatory protein GemA [Nitrospinaceae bacterium]MBT5868023.1 regulatory protein GemA [Nitrospinaceae bacterium]MBT6345403.1 regulatory protein GemA [Nitrospina sp.]